jgi:hypothetical protein
VCHRLSELENHGGGEVDCFFGIVHPIGDDALGLVPIEIVDGRVSDELIVGVPHDAGPHITRCQIGCWYIISIDP